MTENIQLNSAAGSFPVYVNKPEGEIYGGLIVVHEVWGLVDHTRAVADRFAKEGYLVIAPNLLTDLNMPPELATELQKELFDPEMRAIAQPKLREATAPMQAPDFSNKTITKLKACFDYLYNQPETKEKIAIVGFCFGGTYGFSLAANEPRLKAAVPYYGHTELSTEELHNIKCPIMAFYGEDDERLISALPALKSKMKEANVDFTSVVYPDCGHAFFNDTNKFTYNQAAAEDSWRKATVFLDKNLRKG